MHGWVCRETNRAYFSKMHGRVGLIKYVAEVEVGRAFLHGRVGRRTQPCIIWKNAHLGFTLLETKPKGANLHTWDYNPSASLHNNC